MANNVADEGIRKRRLNGRQPIYTAEKSITVSNIRRVIEKAMVVHENNAKDYEFLVNYEKGDQPILHRVKKIRPDINERVVQNHAHQATAFSLAYVYGSPISYVQKAEKESTTDDYKRDDSTVVLLNEMCYEENKPSKDQELASMFLAGGVGYRAVFPRTKSERIGKSIFWLLNLDPKTTFNIYSADVFHRKMLGVTYWDEPDDTAINVHRRHFTAYTNDKVFEFTDDVDSPITVSPNGIGTIPIVEYRQDYQRMGCFERCVDLLDAINLCTSDRLNGLAQFIQSFVWFDNVDLDDEQTDNVLSGGSIFTKSQEGLNARIQILSSALEQNDTQALAMELYQRFLEICHLPGRESSSSSSTGQQAMLGGGWQEAEENAHRQETMFREGEMELLDVIRHIFERSDEKDIKELKISDIDIRFSRNKVSNFLVKTQGLTNLLTSGVHPRIAFQVSDLFTDPQQAWIDSEPFLKAKQEQANNKDNLGDASGKKNANGQDVTNNSPAHVKETQNVQQSFINGE